MIVKKARYETVRFRTVGDTKADDFWRKTYI